MQRRGESNIGTYLVVAGGVLAIYAAIIFIPAVIDNISVREAVAIALNKPFTAPDEARTESILNYVNAGPNAVGYHFEEDENGERIERRGLGLTAENISCSKNETARTVTIYVDYTRELQLKPFKKIKTMTFHIEKEQSFP